ncbi:hypothetical protein WJX72_009317 [[Myrmecia] bisecta]|uniref:Small ribosomal subunit protein bS18c n=1 Tax=[Myrmecia] bisecta TaxID=41462 RepID=A0AAW1P5H5_9CHLO
MVCADRDDSQDKGAPGQWRGFADRELEGDGAEGAGQEAASSSSQPAAAEEGGQEAAPSDAETQAARRKDWSKWAAQPDAASDSLGQPRPDAARSEQAAQQLGMNLHALSRPPPGSYRSYADQFLEGQQDSAAAAVMQAAAETQAPSADMSPPPADVVGAPDAGASEPISEPVSAVQAPEDGEMVRSVEPPRKLMKPFAVRAREAVAAWRAQQAAIMRGMLSAEQQRMGQEVDLEAEVEAEAVWEEEYVSTLRRWRGRPDIATPAGDLLEPEGTVHIAEEAASELASPTAGYAELGYQTPGAAGGERPRSLGRIHPHRLFFPDHTYSPEDLVRSSRQSYAARGEYRQMPSNADVLDFADFRNLSFLNIYVSDGGQLVARRKAKLQNKTHRHLGRQVKIARMLGLLPPNERAEQFRRR